MKPIVAVLLFAVAACGGGHADDDDADDAGTADAGPDAAPPLACGQGESSCDGVCVDLATDEAHCGTCGHACDSGATCGQGDCVATCGELGLDLGAVRSPQNGASSMVVGDWNGDGEIDVAIAAGSFGTTITAMLGSGHGAFADHRQYGVTLDDPLRSGDLDGDGRDDLVLPGSTLHVFHANGDGSFTDQPQAGLSAQDLVIADFDGDTLDDVGYLVTGDIGVAHGSAGGLGAGADVVTGQFADTLAAGDLDGDTRPDLVWAGGSALRTAHNTGTSFAAPSAPVTIPSGNVGEIDWVDVDGGGALDAVVRYAGTNASLLLGNGAGGFGAATPMPIDYDAQFADLTGDGRADEITAAGALCVRAGVGDGSFAAPVCYDARASAVAFADVDGDGTRDAVVAGTGVGVLTGLGGGAFAAPPALALGYAAPYQIADLDGDGAADDVLAGDPYNDALYLLRVGAGGAVSVTTLAGGDYPADARFTDVDGDGAPDLLVGDYQSIGAMHGLGAGAFGPLLPIPGIVPAGLSQLFLGHFDAGTTPDLAIVDQDRARLRVWIGLPAGGFAAAPSATLALTGQPYTVIATDLDGDGLDDLLSSTYDTGVTVFLATGAGAFGAPLLHAGSSGNGTAHIADLDGDGELDVAVGNGFRRGAGDGSFGALELWPLPSDGVLWTGDLDGDSHVDVLVTTYSEMFALLRGTGGGAFVPDREWFGASRPTIADFSGDGAPDLLVFSDGARLVLGGGAGFPLPSADAIAPGISSLVRADFDEDGRDDLALVHGQGMEVLLARPGAPVSWQTSFASELGGTLIAADVDQDGHVDLIRDAAVLHGAGDGTFDEPVDPPLAAARFLTAGYFDGDAWLDLAVFSQVVGHSRVWLGGAGGFVEGPEVSGGYTLTAADLDGDGADDLVFGGFGTSTLVVERGLGDGSFAAAEPIAYPDAIGSQPPLLATADLSGDGDPELIACFPTSGVDLVVFPGTTGAGFAPATVGGLGYSPAGLALADLDGDGARDAVTANGWLTLSRNQGGALRPQASWRAPVTGPVVTGDFTGDGIPDVAAATYDGILIAPGTCTP